MKNKFEYKAGDTVKVYTRVIEGNTERIQIFDGVVIAVRPQTFTVRKTSFGVGVERIFPHNSPRIDKIEVVKRGRVRRAKLYYLRRLSGRAANVQEMKESTPPSHLPQENEEVAPAREESAETNLDENPPDNVQTQEPANSK